MIKLRIAVDLDGTLVENKWPDLGDWLPGAKEALRELDAIAEVIIYTCRVAPVKYPQADDPFDDEPRSRSELRAEVRRLKKFLAKAGFGHLEIWQRPYKPSVDLYIDDKAVRFDGDWSTIVGQVWAA